MKHFDLLTSIQNLINHCSDIMIEFIHIKGHQDDDKDFWELDRWGQLNVIADGIAKDEMTYRLGKDDADNQRYDDLPFDDCKIFNQGKGRTPRGCAHDLQVS